MDMALINRRITAQLQALGCSARAITLTEVDVPTFCPP